MNIDSNRRTLMNAAGALALSSVAVLALAQSNPKSNKKPKERVIKVIAKKFVFVPNEIRVKQGETVLLQFTAPEVPMGFSLPDFTMRADIVPAVVTSYLKANETSVSSSALVGGAGVVIESVRASLEKTLNGF